MLALAGSQCIKKNILVQDGEVFKEHSTCVIKKKHQKTPKRPE